MYLHTTGSSIRERAPIGGPIALGATPGPRPKGWPLRRGQRGGPVFAIQRRLNIWVAKWGLSLPALKEDGVYGEATAERVRAFQQALELTLDGVVGTQTSRWLTQVTGVPLTLGPTGSPSTWVQRYTACLDLKTAGFGTAAAAVRTVKPLTAWVALDIVLRLSTISLRCAASLEWPPRQDGV